MNNKTISKILDFSDYYEAAEEEVHQYPCWEIKVDKENDLLIFLIDFKEQYSHPLGNLDLTMSSMNNYMKVFKKDVNDLETFLNGY